MADTFWKMSMQYNINGGAWGASDVMYYRVDDSFIGTDLGVASLFYWNARRRFMASNVELFSFRWTQLVLQHGKFKSSHDTRKFTASTLGLPATGAAGGDTLGPWDGVLATLTGDAGRVRRPSIFRGIPASMLPDTYPPAVPPFPDPTLYTFFSAFATNVLGPASLGGPSSPKGRFGIKTYDRAALAAGSLDVDDITLSSTAPNYLQYSTEPVATNWAVGDWVIISGNRLGRCQKGVNGRARVKSIIPAVPGPGDVTTVYKRYCCSGTPTLKFPGTIGPLVETVVPFDATLVGSPLVPFGYSLDRPVKRDTGRPFGGTRGRSPSLCC
jgi:hypothetical protein